MTLATHALVGASLATLVPGHEIVAFSLGFASHFILDSIPHWDYKLLSISEDVNNRLNTDMRINHFFIFDIISIGFDIALGLFLSIFMYIVILKHSFDIPFTLLVGAGAAILPDFLQFVYFKIRSEPLKSLQRFHMWIHADTNLNDKPLKGIFYQMCVATTVVVAVYFLR